MRSCSLPLATRPCATVSASFQAFEKQHRCAMIEDARDLAGGLSCATRNSVYCICVHTYIYIHIQVCVYIYIHSSGSHGATDHAPLAHPRSIHLFGPYQRELPHCACSTILCFRFNGYLLSGNKAEPTQWHIDWRKLLKPAYPTFTGLFDFNPRPFCDFCTYQFRAWQGDPFCFLTLLRTS